MSEHKMQPMAEPCHKGFFDGAINLGRCQKDRGHDGACAPERGGYYGSAEIQRLGDIARAALENKS